jgi:two-component system cell cycle sensor histidine kinase/response regulator CckA
MQPQLSQEEVARLNALRDCRVLDTPPEERFDQTTRLAAYLCGTPIGLIGFIDSTRQWFKSRVGWDYPEIPREDSICGQTILQRELMAIPDAAMDERFNKSPVVTRAGIRFYAGAPLLTKEGYAVGTLCVMDRLPRELPAGHRDALLTLAHLVADQLETRRSTLKASAAPATSRSGVLVEQHVAGFSQSTADGRMLDCNATFVRILGYNSREEVLQCHASDFYFSPDEHTRLLEALSKHHRLLNFECRLRKKDGTPLWVVENLFLSSDNQGKAAVIEGTMVDISEHKRTDEALRDSQERLLGIISSAMDAIITVDDNQRIIVFNRAAEQIFRCPATEAIGHSIDKFIPQRFREAHKEHIRNFGQTGVSSRSMYSPGTLMGVRANGEEFPVEATISQVKTASERLYSVILRDISVRKRTEDELRQAQKMEAVGHLAGGIAHEFNNYLGIIMGYSDLLEQEEVQSESLRRGLAEIKGATQKASSLTRQLLAFSRKQLIEPSVLDLNASVWDAHKLLRRLIPANIDVIPVLHPELGKVKADPAQIQQILINLVVNARDAMPQGGKITIETAEVVLDEEFASRHLDVLTGDYIMLSISDSGEGIDAETLTHIFEPFFTTKKVGKGTGLGLSTTYGIVKQSGGHITVASVQGKGTTFRIYFPKLMETYDDGSTAPHSEPMPTGIATILLVEDESGLRRLMRATLERQGYRVLEAKDGAEGLSVCRQNLELIDLVVTDLAMPRMTGLQLKEKVVALRSSMKFLLISGYAEDVLGSREHIANAEDFLEKPFRPDELARKVREILGRINENQEEASGVDASPRLFPDKSDTGTTHG